MVVSSQTEGALDSLWWWVEKLFLSKLKNYFDQKFKSFLLSLKFLVWLKNRQKKVGEKGGNYEFNVCLIIEYAKVSIFI